MTTNLLLLTISISAVVSEGYAASHDWQYLVFAQHWPPTLCLTQKTHKCRVPSYVSSWTVHGIWPTATHGFPSFCNKSLTFNESAIKPIEDQLMVVWPNLFSGESIYSLWKHEWVKHGTCAVSLPQLDTEMKYFSAAIKAHNLYNILSFLKDDDIIPDTQKIYSAESFHKAIESKVGKKAALQCSHVKGFDSPLISTVFLCMDKSLTIIDCPEKDKNCQSFLYLPLRTLGNSQLYASSLQEHNHSLPTTCYIVAGTAFLFIAVMFIWLLRSFRKNKRHGNYVVLIDEKQIKQ